MSDLKYAAKLALEQIANGKDSIEVVRNIARDALAKQEHDLYDEVAIAYGFPKKERFNNWTDVANMKHHIELIEARCDFMREKLELLDKQEPVGQLLEDVFGRGQVMWFNKPKDESMLYTTPQQRKPMEFSEMVRLTYDIDEDKPATQQELYNLIRKVEAAHGIIQNYPEKDKT